MSDKKEVERDILTLPAGPAGNAKFKVKGEEFQVCLMRPATSASVHELQISLKRNRELLEESAKAMYALKEGKEKVDDLKSPTRNALIARANIDMLIPLINVKGGVAAYANQNEAMQIEKHVEKLLADAEKKVAKMTEKKPYDSLILILIVAVLASIILYFLLA